MSTIPHDVVKAFRNQQRQKRGNFQSTGYELYSYRLLIAYWQKGEMIINLPKHYFASPTTSTHLAACTSLEDDRGNRIVKVGPGEWRVINTKISSVTLYNI